MARAPQGLPQPATRRADPSPELRLVGAPGVGRRAGRAVLILAVVGMFAALLISAVFHSVLVSGQQRLDRLDQRVRTDQQRLADARLRVAMLSSPQRVVAAAQKQGMVVPDRVTWLTTPPPVSSPAPAAAPPASLTPPGTTRPAASTPAPSTSVPGASASGRLRAAAAVVRHAPRPATPPATASRRPGASPTTGTTTRSGPTR